MDIQQVFYYMATIAMAMTILVMLILIGLLFYIQRKISNLDKYCRVVIAKGNNIVEEVTNKLNYMANLKARFLGKPLK